MHGEGTEHGLHQVDMSVVGARADGRQVQLDAERGRLLHLALELFISILDAVPGRRVGLARDGKPGGTLEGADAMCLRDRFF